MAVCCFLFSLFIFTLILFDFRKLIRRSVALLRNGKVFFKFKSNIFLHLSFYIEKLTPKIRRLHARLFGLFLRPIYGIYIPPRQKGKGEDAATSTEEEAMDISQESQLGTLDMIDYQHALDVINTDMDVSGEEEEKLHVTTDESTQEDEKKKEGKEGNYEVQKECAITLFYLAEVNIYRFFEMFFFLIFYLLLNSF
jgi:hypothetical protein